MNVITVDRLKELLHYDPETGVFTWVGKSSKMSHNVIVGGLAGSINGDGYLSIGIDGKRYQTHRLAFLYMEGYIPENFVDHINRDRSDNRWCNLREVSNTCNVQNSNNRKDNTSGVKGVSWFSPRNTWVARITYKGKRKPVKYTKDFIEAVCYRLAAEQCYDWNGCYGDSSAFQYLRKVGVP